MEQIDLFEAGVLEWPEVWRDVVGYEGLYQVSSFGRVKRIENSPHRKAERVLKYGVCSRNGAYLSVCLCKENIKRTLPVHRLVAEAFIQNPKNYPCINHKDENKHNNTIDNLEWCSYEQNDNYGTRNERISKTNSIQVNQLTLDGQLIKTWSSMKESEDNGFEKSSVCMCCKGRRHHHKGYRWEYA